MNPLMNRYNTMKGKNKMDKKYRLLYLIIAYIGLLPMASCTNELPYNPKETEPQLIVNALLQADTDENYVYLLLSGTHQVGYVNEGSVTLYVNGSKAEVAEEIKPNESEWEGRYIPPIMRRKKFRLNTVLKPGDTVLVEATAEHGKYRSTAEVKVPKPVAPLKVEATTALLRTNNTLSTHRLFKITLQDLPNEDNYYRLEIRQTTTERILINGEEQVFVKVEEEKLINREDVILTDGHPLTGNDDVDEGLTPHIANKYNIFSDERFRNETATLKVYTPIHENRKGYYYQESEMYHRTVTATIRITSISKEQYKYLRALNTLESDEYDEILMEPISIPSNVNGGIGLVGIASARESVIELVNE